MVSYFLCPECRVKGVALFCRGEITYFNISFLFQEIYGYRRSIFRTILTWSFIIETLGLLRMIFHWFPEWFLKCTHKKCSLESAEVLLIVVRHFLINFFSPILKILKLNRKHIRRNIGGYTSERLSHFLLWKLCK